MQLQKLIKEEIPGAGKNGIRFVLCR
jgi:hypothetical protein